MKRKMSISHPAVRRIYTSILALLMTAFCAAAELRTVQVHPAGHWDKSPVIALGGEEQVEISFDEMSHDYHRFAYRLIHCDADWKRSRMNELEYMEGFSENDVPDGENSQGTLVEYTHYQLILPNEDVSLKLSGNYRVEIFDRDADDDKAIVEARFSVLDRQFGVEASASPVTAQGYSQTSHQVEVEVKTPQGQVKRADTELKVTVRQNRRTDTQVTASKPQMQGPSSIRYHFCPELVFKAGNEYRRCEFSSYKIGGMGVDRIRFERPYYHIWLYEDAPRLSGYTYDEDQDGRFYIRSQQASDNTLEADYFQVHFRLSMPAALPGEVYLGGDLTAGRFDESSRMAWSPEEKAYVGTFLLKQGAYNYQYFYSENGQSPSASRFEGDYWATEDEYEVFVYFRPMGGQYDQLVGYSDFKSKP